MIRRKRREHTVVETNGALSQPGKKLKSEAISDIVGSFASTFNATVMK